MKVSYLSIQRRLANFFHSQLAFVWKLIPLLFALSREDEYLVNMQHTVIPSWYQREGYVKSMATLIQSELQTFDKPREVL